MEQGYMERIRFMKDRVVNTRPEMDLENARLLTESFQETEGEPLCIRKAKAFRHQCRNKDVTIWDRELIVGCSGSKMRGGILCADTCWSILDDELETISQRKYDPFYLREEDRALFTEVIKPYWKGKSTYEAWLKQIPEDCRDLRDTGQVYINRKAVRGWGETTAGYKQIITEGIESICETIRAELDLTDPGAFDKDNYLRALLISAEGICDLAERYAAEAERLAEKEADPQRKQELRQIAEHCHHVPRYPARTFHEALQSLYLYQICIFMEQNAASYNPGRMDQYLYPYYQADLANGTLTEEQAQELLDCLWVKFSEPCLFQDAVTAEFAAGYPMFRNVCVGGVTTSGRDAVNPLSYLILQATMDVQLYQPCSTPESQGKCGAEGYGKEMTAAQVVREVCKDEIFFFHSGGVTVSGGEVLLQPEFACGILKSCMEQGIATAIETSLYADWPVIEKLLPYLADMYVDFKLYEDAAHRVYTGVSNARIKENLRRLERQYHGDVHIRIPTVPGVNMTEENMRQTGVFLAKNTRIREVELLPYHRLGLEIYRKLGRRYALADTPTPSMEEMRRMAAVFTETEPGFRMKIKGEPVKGI